MVTPLGTAFSIDEKAMSQADVQLLEKTLESLVIEFNQGKFEEFLSSGSASPKTMRQYRKASFTTRSRVSSKISPRVVRTSTYSASGASSNEVLKTSLATFAARVNISKETRRANASVHVHNDGEDQSRHYFPL